MCRSEDVDVADQHNDSPTSSEDAEAALPGHRFDRIRGGANALWVAASVNFLVAAAGWAFWVDHTWDHTQLWSEQKANISSGIVGYSFGALALTTLVALVLAASTLRRSGVRALGLDLRFLAGFPLAVLVMFASRPVSEELVASWDTEEALVTTGIALACCIGVLSSLGAGRALPRHLVRIVAVAGLLACAVAAVPSCFSPDRATRDWETAHGAKMAAVLSESLSLTSAGTNPNAQPLAANCWKLEASALDLSSGAAVAPEPLKTHLTKIAEDVRTIARECPEQDVARDRLAGVFLSSDADAVDDIRSGRWHLPFS
jgi:hypothetical protein